MNKTLLLVALAALPLLAHGQTPPKKPAAPAKVVPAPAPAPAAAAAPAPAPSTAPIGTVTLVTGVASVTVGGQPRALGAGDPVYEGQVISEGPNSYANLKFNDGGRILLRPNTEFAVESYRFAPPAAPAAAPAATTQQPVAGNAFFRLVRGGFRAVTGLIGQGDRAAYRVSTPAATIGIRGTDYEVVTCADDCPTQARVAAGHTEVASTELAGLELAQAGAGCGGGIIVATNAGSVVLRTARGDTTVDAGQVALSLATGETLKLPVVPDALLVNATPAPADCE